MRRLRAKLDLQTRLTDIDPTLSTQTDRGRAADYIPELAKQSGRL
ncbi:hypothetical protein [Pararhodobacter sp.]|nr:hypothetical protein [Pararhodobacter sp.]